MVSRGNSMLLLPCCAGVSAGHPQHEGLHGSSDRHQRGALLLLHTCVLHHYSWGLFGPNIQHRML
jgi:hypothetical protein